MKVAGWLIFPALLLVGVIEHNMRERSVRADYARLDQEGTYEETRAVSSLVEGCVRRKTVIVSPAYEEITIQSYVRERLFGTCRSLANAPLEKAKLNDVSLNHALLSDARFDFSELRNAYFIGALSSGTNFRGADLTNATLNGATFDNADFSNANLHSADLRKAYLYSANLHNADLSEAIFNGANLYDADLSKTDLSSANLANVKLDSASLKEANLSSAVILNTDLRLSKDIVSAQVSGLYPPFLCNSPLPSNLEVNKDRDCEKLADVLYERHPEWYESKQEAQAYVDEQRQKFWEPLL